MNPQVIRRRKLAGNSTDVQDFDGSKSHNWVIGIDKPLRGIQINLSGQLIVNGGGTDPNATLDVLLKIMGTMSLYVGTSKGTFYVLPEKTRVDFFYRAMERLKKCMLEQQDHGGIVAQPTFNGEPGYFGVTGKNGSVQPFSVKLYIPLGVVGAPSHEADRSMFVKHVGDTSIQFNINPSLGVNGVYAPFPGTNNTYTFKDLLGNGSSAKIQLILDQVEDYVPSSKAGEFLPSWEQKSLVIDWTNTDFRMGVMLKDWLRGGRWHAIFHNEQYLLSANGGVEQGAIISFPGSEGAADTVTLPRDFTIKAQEDVLLEENLLEIVAEQHPFPHSSFRFDLVRRAEHSRGFDQINRLE